MATAYYLVESSYFNVSHGGRDSQGVFGAAKGSMKIYLHVIPLSAAEVKALRPFKDDGGTADFSRYTLPGREDWWIAVEGEASWPKIHRPRLTSHFQDTDAGSLPVPLSDAELDLLRKAGLTGV
jgi:hypothetical protein